MFQKRIATVLLTAALVCVLAGCGGDPDKGKLLFKPAVGDSRTLATSSSFVLAVTNPMMKMDFNASKDTSYKLVVDSVEEDGTVNLTATYESLVIDFGGTMGMGTEVMSLSDVVDPDPLNESLEGLTGKSFKLKVSKFGEVLEVTGADEIAKGLVADVETPDDVPVPVEMNELAVDFLGNEPLKNFLGMAFFKVPDKPLNPGDSWVLNQDELFEVPEETKAELEKEMGKPFSGLPFTMALTHTMQPSQGTLAKVNVAGDFALDPDKFADMIPDEATAGNPYAKDMKFDMKGTTGGTVEVEVPSGWPFSRVLTSEVKGQIQMNMEGMGMSIPVDLNIKLEATYL